MTTREYFRKLRAEHWAADHWQAGRVDQLAQAIDGLHEWRSVEDADSGYWRTPEGVRRAYHRALQAYGVRPTK